MKALSVKQPWANLILMGEKTIEVRKQNIKHRGDLLICSSKTPAFSSERMQQVESYLRVPYLFGHALCVVRLKDSRPLRAGDENATYLDAIKPGMHGWVLDSLRPVVPFPVRGRLGLYDVDDALIRPAPHALWDCVHVRGDAGDGEHGFSLTGWHGRVLCIELEDDGRWICGFAPDSRSVDAVPLTHIQACVALGTPWYMFRLAADALEPATARDTVDQAQEATLRVEDRHPELFPR